MKKRAGFLLSALLALMALAALIISPVPAAEAARGGIELCLKTIVPSLFPFMVLGTMISELGITQRVSRILSPVTKRLFGVSGACCTPFLLGLCGGYPLGSVSAAQLYKNGNISKHEAERLLGFCDNTGPAFIIGVAGGAVFQSAAVGLFLYGAHIFSAVLTGMLLSWRRGSYGDAPVPELKSQSLPSAFSGSVRRCVSTCAAVCGFVVFFSVVIGLLTAHGTLPALVGRLSYSFGLELHFVQSLVIGLLELGGGISSMAGLSASAASLALCSFILAFGGLSVHAQAFSVIAEGGLSSARHLFGKLLHGGLSALVTLIAYPLFF